MTKVIFVTDCQHCLYRVSLSETFDFESPFFCGRIDNGDWIKEKAHRFEGLEIPEEGFRQDCPLTEER